MKCQYRVNADLMLELEAANQKELFERMAEAAEVFGGWACCGKCKKMEFKPRPVVRLNAKKQKFFELHCTNPACRARFAYGQSQSSPTLFPQRKFPKGHQQAEKFKPDGGWVVWSKEDDGAGEADIPVTQEYQTNGKDF